MICDSGPLIALLDGRDVRHLDCTALIDSRLPELFLTTMAVVTESLYLLRKKGGIRAQDALLRMIVNGDVEVVHLTIDDFVRVREIMQQYADLPMDFADATLVVIAERLMERTVFTLDHHFHIYKPRGFDHFDIVP